MCIRDRDHPRRRPGRQGHHRPLGPIRQGDAAARQEAQAADQHQATQSQPEMERSVRFRRSELSDAGLSPRGMDI